MVERATFWIDQASLAKVVHVLKLISVKAPGNVDSLAPKTGYKTGEGWANDKHFKKIYNE